MIATVEPSKNKFYVTTPIYYANAKPHIGHAYTTIAADILTRYYRLLNYDVFFATGTDEHGLKIQQTAARLSKHPQELVDENSSQFKQLWQLLNISYNKFIRTTSAEHIKTVQYVVAKSYENGDIYKGYYEGYYCTGCEEFKSEEELLNGYICPIHKTACEYIKEETYYFRLSKYADVLLNYYKSNLEFVKPLHRYKEVIQLVRQGLPDISITRPRSRVWWGIPAPFDSSHTIYVWFDALVNYLSVFGYPNSASYTKYWPADLHLVGKDILKFHAIIWPALLLSIGEPLPKQIFAHGWWLVNGHKMSKSLGNIIDPFVAANKLGADAFRYILFREAAFGEDGNLTREAIINRINGELVNNIGNLYARFAGLVHKYLNGELYLVNSNNLANLISSAIVNEYSQLVRQTLAAYNKYLQSIKLHKALDITVQFAKWLNSYIDRTKLWQRLKDLSNTNTKIQIASATLTLLADGLFILSHLLYPFMPSASLQALQQLSLSIQLESDLIRLTKLEPFISILSIANILKPAKKIRLFNRITETDIDFIPVS